MIYTVCRAAKTVHRDSVHQDSDNRKAVGATKFNSALLCVFLTIFISGCTTQPIPPTGNQSGSASPTAAPQTDTSRTDTSQPDAFRTDTSQPGASQTDTSQPDRSKFTAQSNTSQLDTSPSNIASHPLDPLTAREIEDTTRILKKAGKITAASRFASISLNQPDKSAVLKFKVGEKFDRKSFAVIYEAASNKTFEAIVDLSAQALSTYKQAKGQALVPEDVTVVRSVVRADKEWQAAMHKRGVQDLADVYIAVWASAYLPEKAADRKRMLKAFFYYRGKSDNAYLRPIEGVLAEVDLSTKKVVKLTDTGLIPISPTKVVSIPAAFAPNVVQGNPADIKRADVEVAGHSVHWKNWRFRYAVEPREGLVLYTVSYDDHGKIRPIMYRGSVSELCVPYADPSAGWSFRDAFDVGQYGLGASASSLEPLTDAPADAQFFDAIIADQIGVPVKHERAVALYEKDGGILWRHFDRPNKRQLSVRGTDLVLSFITTLSNYDYCFNWIFHEDGTLEMETGMTGVMLAKGVEHAQPGADPHAHAVEKTIEAVHHQHFFCFRLDMDVDGAANNSLLETNGVTMPELTKNPYGNAFCMSETKLRGEKDAVRALNMNTTRRWKVVNENEKNKLGQQTGYMLVPGENSIPYSTSTSYVRKRAGFINSHVWATAYDPTQLYAAGDYPFDSDGSNGLPDWIKANHSLEKKDIVLWYTMGITHTPRPEEWPIMPVHRSGFKLIPNCFFEKNPALSYEASKP